MPGDKLITNEEIKVIQSVHDRIARFELQGQFKVQRISNGWVMQTRSGKWYYRNSTELLGAISDYLKVLAKEMEAE